MSKKESVYPSRVEEMGVLRVSRVEELARGVPEHRDGLVCVNGLR